jgi:hypothetical protein
LHRKGFDFQGFEKAGKDTRAGASGLLKRRVQRLTPLFEGAAGVPVVAEVALDVERRARAQLGGRRDGPARGAIEEPRFEGDAAAI